jgi:integrase
MKPGDPPLLSLRLLDQVRERSRYLHYSLATEKAYLYWVRFFIRWHGLRHPRDMGAAEAEAFLTMLATQRKVSSSTHNQALSALLFLYREVMGVQLPWLDNVRRPAHKRRIPSVLTPAEVAAVLDLLQGEVGLLARLLYGTGMRLMEGLRLRIKDVDFDRHAIVVREAKGNKDRVVMLPRSLAPDLRAQLLAARATWERDRLSTRVVSKCRTHWRPSTHRSATPGPGSGCFPRQGMPSTQAPASSGATTCSKNGCSAHSSALWHRLASPSRCRSTRCAIRSRRICCRRGPISERYRSCWATATSAPR